MKILALFFCIISLRAHAVDPKTYITTFDSKVYSLKTKGVKDFAVDVKSSRLLKQLNEQMIFGRLKDLTFRVYWTANPERLALDVLGLPEGFKEVKEELKLSILSGMDNLVPVPVMDRFKGYNMTQGTGAKEFTAQDTTGVAAIPSYVLRFDANDCLANVKGNRIVGSFNVATTYEKENFTDGKWLLKKQVTTSEENGQTTVSTKDLDYGESSGIGVLEEVELEITQTFQDSKMKPVTTEETLEFKNYKINTGEALKYFLGDAAKK